MQQAQDELKEAISQFDWLYKEPRAVPSTVGQTLDNASKRLGRSELQVGSVRQEYSDKVAKAHVISQVPGPGARLNKNSAVRVVISKGPPPDKEKHMRLRKREAVRGQRFSAKADSDRSAIERAFAASISGIVDPAVFTE